MKKIVLYSQPGCPPCFAAKHFLKEHGAEFEYKDVSKDPVAMRELMDLGSRSTPTILVDKELMIGFDPARLEHLIKS